MTMLIRSGHYIWDEAITTSTCQTTTTTTTTWNLYENPIYNSSPQVAVHHERLPEEQNQQERRHDDCNHHQQKFHSLHLPVSARKMATSFWDLTFIRPSLSSASIMKKNSEHLDAAARAQITALKTELEYQRKARKKMKLTNKKLSAELSEEKKARQVLERICDDLAHKISSHKLDMDRMRRDMEDERKTLRVAEVFREERVRMKLADAKFLLDSKLLELDRHHQTIGTCPQVAGCNACLSSSSSSAALVAEQGGGEDQLEESISRHVFGAKKRSEATRVDSSSSSLAKWMSIALPGPENPHIKRGIKGFVEFPKLVRAKTSHLSSAAGSSSSKLDCQKAQLGILLKQKCMLLPSSSHNLTVMS